MVPVLDRCLKVWFPGNLLWLSAGRHQLLDEMLRSVSAPDFLGPEILLHRDLHSLFF